MAFSDEVKKLQRTLRCYLRFQTGTGSENPGVTGPFTDRRWGKVADNTGGVPVKGTVSKFGTFSRALTNADQGFEAPSVSTELLDKDNEWRTLASRPWTILNRFFYYVLRVRDDTGAYLDADVAWGQLTLPEFSPGGKAKITVQMVPDYLGTKVPKRKVTSDDWPNADNSAIGKMVPIVYGKMDNSVGVITGFTGVKNDPNTAAAPVITAVTAVPGGNEPIGSPLFYAIAALDAPGGSVISPLSNVAGVVVDHTNTAAQITWTHAGAGGFRLFRSPTPDFNTFDQYKDGGVSRGSWDIPGASRSLTDTFTGVDSTLR